MTSSDSFGFDKDFGVSTGAFNVFVCSGIIEFQDVRRTIYLELNKHGYIPFVYELSVSAGPNPISKTCLQEVAQADFLVALFDKRIGDVTRDEFLHAKRIGIPRFVFIRSRRIIDQTEEKLRENQQTSELKDFLEKEVTSLDGGVTPVYFEYPDQLVKEILKGIRSYVTSCYRDYVRFNRNVQIQESISQEGLEKESRKLESPDKRIVFITDRPFFELADQLDALIKLQEISQQDAETLLELLRNEPLERYFFKHLADSANPAWFPFLKEQGYFDKYPEPIKDGIDISYPRFLAQDYLAMIAPKLSEYVVDVIDNMQVTNAFGLPGLVKIFSKISPDYASRASGVLLRWLDKGLPVTEELIATIEYWAKNGQWQAALPVVGHVLSPREAPASKEQRESKYYSPHPAFRDFHYTVEQLLKLLPALPGIPLADILSILEEKLIQALQIEDTQKHYENVSYWRSSIEPSSQNIGGGYKDFILNALVELIEQLTLEKKSKLVERYLSHQIAIFRRLALHIIRTTEKLWSEFLRQIYADTRYWDEIDYYHEYWLLTQDTFQSLKTEQQLAYLNRLLQETDQEAKKEGGEIHARNWLYRRLWPIQEVLPSDVNATFTDLRKEFPEPDPPEWFSFLSYVGDVKTILNVSSKTSDELIKMLPEETFEELKKDYPTGRTTFDEPSMEGLADELTNAIKVKPTRFTSILDALLKESIHPLYILHVVQGFSLAWGEKRSFDWKPVLAFCTQVTQITETQPENDSPIDMQPAYWYDTLASARKAIVDLMQAAVSEDEHAIDSSYLDEVRDILLVLADDANPSPEYEANSFNNNNWGYLDLSLNVTRAKAIATLIQYALHRSRVAKDKKGLLPESTRLEPRVRNKLSEKLDTRIENSLSVHINFGIYLPNLNYLDNEWFLIHLEDIFPRHPDRFDHWQAAWDGYMWRRDVFVNLYENIRPYYLHAVENLTKLIKGKSRDKGAGLAIHLAYLYADGKEPLDGDRSLIAQFFEVAPDNLRGKFVETLLPGKISNAQDPESEEWGRLKDLWLHRYEYIKDQKEIGKFKDELSNFLIWLQFVPEPIEQFEDMIRLSVSVASDLILWRLFELLAKLVEKLPAFVIGLFEIVIQRQDLPVYLFSSHEEVRVILETAINSDSKEARDGAVRIINIYGERGNESYRDLLQSSDLG